MTDDRADVVIVGAGQAGLAVSRELTQAAVAHVLLEKGKVGQTWRGRWDSFCLVTPNWFLQLPGHPYDGGDPDGFIVRDEVVAYLERYAAGFEAPVREGVEVTSLQPGPDGGFLLETSAGQIAAGTVVLSTGAYQRPHRPAGAATLAADLLQIDVEGYRNPADVPSGPVLVVGSGQSGCQIAEELHQAGREVFLACGRASWMPRRLGDRDLAWWALETGFLDAPVSSLPSPAARLAANVQATGAGGGHDLHYRTLRKMGVTLLGHFLGADGRHARFAPDLGESVAWGDERNAQLMDLVRTLVVERGLPRPEIPEPEPFDADAPEELNLSAFGAVVFAGGFRPDYESWVRFPGAFDEFGFPIHREGASTVAPGLYFVGVHYHPRPAVAPGSTSSASTSSASASQRSSTGWAKTPPSSPARSPPAPRAIRSREPAPAKRGALLATVSVRYIVNDVDAAIDFYCGRLGFHEDMHPAPSFAMLSRGDLRLVLSAPAGGPGGGQAMPDGTLPEPGGWNRFQLEVTDLAATVEELRTQGARFRSEIITGVGGKQILVEDPSGNPIELFEPTRPEASLSTTS